MEDKGNKSFILNIEKPTKIGLFTQHTAEEFNMKVIKSDENKEIPFNTERFWQAEHEHDDEVGSIAIERFGDVDPEKLNTWMGRLLSEKGVDIFRTKGFISYSGNPRRIVSKVYTCYLLHNLIKNGVTNLVEINLFLSVEI